MRVRHTQAAPLYAEANGRYSPPVRRCTGTIRPRPRKSILSAFRADAGTLFHSPSMDSCDPAGSLLGGLSKLLSLCVPHHLHDSCHNLDENVILITIVLCMMSYDTSILCKCCATSFPHFLMASSQFQGQYCSSIACNYNLATSLLIFIRHSLDVSIWKYSLLQAWIKVQSRFRLPKAQLENLKALFKKFSCFQTFSGFLSVALNTMPQSSSLIFKIELFDLTFGQ